MRRIDRQMKPEAAAELVKKASYGVLSMTDADGIPYAIPINYYYAPQENALYMHCAVRGRKLDCIQANPKVSFVVVGSEKIIPERFTTYFESVIISGTASLIESQEEKIRHLIGLCEALTPGDIEKRDMEISNSIKAVNIIKVEIESMTGKKNPSA